MQGRNNLDVQISNQIYTRTGATVTLLCHITVVPSSNLGHSLINVNHDLPQFLQACTMIILSNKPLR
jgi:hypothetical protein